MARTVGRLRSPTPALPPLAARRNRTWTSSASTRAGMGLGVPTGAFWPALESLVVACRKGSLRLAAHRKGSLRARGFGLAETSSARLEYSQEKWEPVFCPTCICESGDDATGKKKERPNRLQYFHLKVVPLKRV